MKRYPRDMSGYGPTPPAAQWPGGAKIAVQLVLNYEEGGENNILHGDAASEAFLSEIVGAAAWPGQRHWNMESIYEYGARAGFWRLHRMLKDLPITVYGVATALARAPEQLAAMKSAGWEIASHGLKWIEYKDASPEDEAADMARPSVCTQRSWAHRRAAGTRGGARKTQSAWPQKPGNLPMSPTAMLMICPIGWNLRRAIS